MKASKIILATLIAVASTSAFVSCDNNNDDYGWVDHWGFYPNALVTVKPTADGSCFLQLDDSTTLYPVNLDKAPYGDKEVRALGVIEEVKNANSAYTKSVEVYNLDSIRTKPAVALPAGGKIESYGNDPVEIVKDWVNVVEDGYLTLRFRTRWDGKGTVHYINLITGVNPNDPYEVVLAHNANGDTNGWAGDAMVAFKLSTLPDGGRKPMKLTVRYMSYSGEKKLTFEYPGNKITTKVSTAESNFYGKDVK